MAFVTGTAHGNTLTLQAWSSKFHRQSDKENFLEQAGLRAMDPGDESPNERRPSAPIIVQEQLNAGRAQKVHVGLRMNLTTNHGTTVRVDSDDNTGLTDATYGTTTMIDEEEVMTLNSFTCYVNQMKHATGFDTPEIQDLRTELKMTGQAAEALNDWFTVEKEESTLDALYHLHSSHIIGESLASASDPQTLNQIFGDRVSSLAALEGSNRLTAQELRRLFTYAITKPMNPIKAAGGVKGYVLLVHPFCYQDLWDDEEFRNYQQGGNVRGTGNPAFDMADFEFHGIYLKKYQRIRTPPGGANKAFVRRCILLGADAVAEGVTMRPRLVRRKEDKYEDFFGLAVKGINGHARADWAPTTGTTFNQSSAVASYYTADAA
jgi:hypothetical protein